MLEENSELTLVVDLKAGARIQIRSCDQRRAPEQKSGAAPWGCFLTRSWWGEQMGLESGLSTHQEAVDNDCLLCLDLSVLLCKTVMMKLASTEQAHSNWCLPF